MRGRTGRKEHKAVNKGAIHRLGNRSLERLLRRNGHRHRSSTIAGNGNCSAPELAQAFIAEQVAACREQIGDKKALLALSLIHI